MVMVEEAGDIVELFYLCKRNDYFFINSLECAEMGFQLLRDDHKISL